MAIFWDLQPLWSSSLTKPDLLRFRCSSGYVLSKTKSVTPHFFTFLTSLTHHLSMVKFSEKKLMLEKFRANVLNCIYSVIQRVKLRATKNDYRISIGYYTEPSMQISRKIAQISVQKFLKKLLNTVEPRISDHPKYRDLSRVLSVFFFHVKSQF